MAGGALFGIDRRAGSNRASPGGQSGTIVAAGVDVPAGDFAWRGGSAVAEMAGFGGRGERRRGDESQPNAQRHPEALAALAASLEGCAAGALRGPRVARPPQGDGVLIAKAE